MLFKFLNDHKQLIFDRKYLLEGMEEAIADLEKLRYKSVLSMEEDILLGNAIAVLKGRKRGAELYGYQEGS